ncbi:MAG: hypothetical protein COB49_12450 [Alphaproteobacteria bacterium]|nr:MAG: hypothetical protein COB49_12450 [Alphaproteobacteria bacterium]
MVKPSKIKDQPRKIRKYMYLTTEEAVRFEETAAMSGLAESVFLRRLALAKEIRPKKARQAQNLVFELSKTMAELNRVGNNLNQLAYQANLKGYIQDVANLEAYLSELRLVVEEIGETIKRV